MGGERISDPQPGARLAGERLDITALLPICSVLRHDSTHSHLRCAETSCSSCVCQYVTGRRSQRAARRNEQQQPAADPPERDMRRSALRQIAPAADVAHGSTDIIMLRIESSRSACDFSETAIGMVIVIVITPSGGRWPVQPGLSMIYYCNI